MTLLGKAPDPCSVLQLLCGQLPSPCRLPQTPSRRKVQKRTELSLRATWLPAVRQTAAQQCVIVTEYPLTDVLVTLTGGAGANAAADAASGRRPSCRDSIAAAAEAAVTVEAAHRAAAGHRQGSGPPSRRCCRCVARSVEEQNSHLQTTRCRLIDPECRDVIPPLHAVSTVASRPPPCDTYARHKPPLQIAADADVLYTAGVGTRRAEAEAASSPAPQPKRLRASAATPPVPDLSKGSLSRAAAGVIAASGGAMLQEPSRGGQTYNGGIPVGASWSAGDITAPEVSSHQLDGGLRHTCSVNGSDPAEPTQALPLFRADAAINQMSHTTLQSDRIV